MSVNYGQILKVSDKSTKNILDSFAGAGRIPFEAIRLGLDTTSIELNPVATLIQKATIEYPLKYQESLITDIEKIAKKISQNCREKLSPYYPEREGEEILDYLFARTVICKECKLNVPLSPNW